MKNSIEHKIPTKINNLIKIVAPDYQILKIVGTGVTDYYPSLDENGNNMSILDYSIEEIMAAKVHRRRLTIRLLIEGNAIEAENYIKSSLGYDCLAIAQEYVDIYIPLMIKK